MLKSIKRLLLIGVAVTVMICFAAPAMANDYDSWGPLATDVSEYSYPDSPEPYPDPYPCFQYYPC
jgi:hypothetical protein